ncbi:MAG: hypothetical protein E7435_01145 [Ruminococcaceae bacterium]|nr:hypothetical protein [Oscillospiraceae bacterium]
MEKCNNIDNLTYAERILLSRISALNASGSDIPPELYRQFRNFEIAWLSRNYSTDTIEQINSIPVRADLPRAPVPANSIMSGPTGEVYYYLHSKAQQYASEQKYDLAIACQQKSNDLMRLKYPTHRRTEAYYLVRLLARSGRLEDAKNTKKEIDAYYGKAECDESINALHKEIRNAHTLGTDYLIMTTEEFACSECAKYQGRVYSISGKSKKYPPLPYEISKYGCVHPGCTHRFFAYIDNMSSNSMKITLAHHPIKNIFYKRNIVSFSNRPFADDRTKDCKKAVEEVRQREAKRKEQQQHYEDHIIEIEYQKHLDDHTLIWLQNNFPAKAPKNITSFRRMRTQNTKNYQTLKLLAAEKGKEI